ncbi:MAG TPA: hypothetical protein VFY71_01185 [Planctomycetota bacterium]|nr:hypothetical protein [Planctomycetota bacterium]
MSSLSLRGCVPLLLLAPAALAGAIVGPHGFNVETHPDAGSLLLPLPGGGELLATGSFGANGIARRLPDGSVIPFATGFGSLAGAAISPVTGQLVVGDSFGPVALHVLTDTNGDLDCLDAGEDMPYPVALPVLPNGAAPLPFDIVFEPGTDDLYVSGSTPFAAGTAMGAVVKFAAGAASIFADGLGFAAGMQWSGETLYVADVDALSFVGRVVRLHDGDADGDALDAGEAGDFASGLSGGSDLVIGADGSVYVSGLFDVGTFTGAVGRLAADGDGDGITDGVDEAFLHGFNFATGLSLSEGAGGFVAGVGGDGTLRVGDIDFAGDILVRSAPFAGTELSGTVANNHKFTLTVTGDPGAGALLALSLDLQGITIAGLGDLGLGFGAPHLVLVLAPLDAGGASATTIVLHDADALVGTAFAAQGFTLQAGEIGLGNTLSLVIAP